MGELITLDRLVAVTGGFLQGKVPSFSIAVDLIVTDSRRAQPGSVFFALRGDRFDGHDFVRDAVAKGAKLAVVSKRHCLKLSGMPLLIVDEPLRAYQSVAAYWRRCQPAEVIGITGSVGKTSAKELVASVLSRRFYVLANEGSLNNEIGLPATLLRLRSHHQWAVLEMGGAFRMGEIAELADICLPRLGIVTNVSVVHLERMKTIENIARNKSELVEALPPDGLAVLNADDPLVTPMAARSKAPVVTYGMARTAQYRVVGAESLGLRGTRVSVEGPCLRIKDVVMPHLGVHVGYHAALAVAVAHRLGLSADEIVEGLMDPSTVVRARVIPIAGFTVIDDSYNSSPLSALSALEVLRKVPGRHIAVLGDMLELGSYEERGHREVGEAAARCVDVLIAVGPRSRVTAAAAQAAGDLEVHVVEGVEQAFDLLAKVLQPGDTVLVKGSHAVGLSAVVDRLLSERGTQ
jgi:UDP-N-acetylmuramoyl-tripeptide--D-alanyl-D-alanine ligase